MLFLYMRLGGQETFDRSSFDRMDAVDQLRSTKCGQPNAANKPNYTA